ncbi:MAG: hypothetical protein A4E66_00169 [Syntrophus sp. PtaB.Bin001]|nr:MAG: hypothetical protein A4E66_00169 [Syntrophus sp. PtaB.Bin001]
MITLDAALAAAQDSQTRKPICKIVSKENVDPIPFDGELLSTGTLNEQYPQARSHSTGRLFMAFMVGPDSGHDYVLRYGYTDSSRTYFTYVDFPLADNHVGGEVSVYELADSYVDLIWEETYLGTRYIKYRKITVTGADSDPAVAGTIFTVDSDDFFTGPAFAKLPDDSYVLVYGLQDGSDYRLYYRTSSNFTTWSSAAEIDLLSLTSTNRKANPSLLVLSSGAAWLLFDYVESIGPNGEELTNIYYVTSSDNFSTNSTPAALTVYTGYGEVAEHPAAAQSAAGTIYMAFDRVVSSLKIDKDSTGWTGTASPVSNMHVDIANQKLYVVSSVMGYGVKTLICVVKVDLDTWTIDKCWTTSSVPAFPSYFSNTMGVWYDAYHGAGHYVLVGHANGVISVLDGKNDTIITYAFYDLSAYGIAKNVTWSPVGSGIAMTIEKAWIDASSNKLYVALTRNYTFSACLQIGWIDLTQSGPAYTFTTIVSEDGTISISERMGLTSAYGWMEINVNAGLIIVSMEGIGSDWKGSLRIYDLSTGGLWKNYTVDSNPTFPYRGLRRGVYNKGFIVGDFTYESLYGQADNRGLCIINTATDVIIYSRPSWESVNDYGLKDICLTDQEEYLVAADGYGIALFDGAAWALYDNNNLPGLTPTGEDNFTNPVSYNPTTRMIIAGHGDDYFDNWSGLVMFSRDGYIRQSSYITGTLSGTVWSWNSIAPLVQGFTDYAAALVFDPDDNLYAFWVNQNGTELSIKWDKDLADFDLTPYLLHGEVVERSSSIDPSTGNWDADLRFSCSSGHLFDTSNNSSMLKQYLSKGRKIEQQFGELISGVEYLEPKRVFTISSDGELAYESGTYPTINVECETPRKRWEQIHITASEYYETTPELIIADLITTYDASKTSADINLGTWDNSKTIEYQFVDMSLADAVDLIAIHFGYAIRDGAEGIIGAVKITDSGSITRTYSNNTKLFKATPKNDLSSFINQWIVTCEEKSFTELLMEEELAAEFAVSHRWNTGTKKYKINYTQGNKTFRNPRLDVVESVRSIMFKLAGDTSEQLIDSSHDEANQDLWDTYSEIAISSPDLTAMLAGAVALLAASYAIGDIETEEETIPLGSYTRAFATWIALNILASTCNCQYRIYGQPVVKTRRTLQATSDDSESQVKMGQVITDTYTDDICGSVAEGQEIADFRKMVAINERKRWASEMAADLHNEEGDKISVIHPFSSQSINVFLTDLKTSYLASNAGENNGYFKQSFEGWRA